MKRCEVLLAASVTPPLTDIKFLFFSFPAKERGFHHLDFLQAHVSPSSFSLPARNTPTSRLVKPLNSNFFRAYTII